MKNNKLIKLFSKRNKQERKSCDLCTKDFWCQRDLNNYDKGKPAVEMHGTLWGSFCLGRLHEIRVEELKKLEKKDEAWRASISIKEEDLFSAFLTGDSYLTKECRKNLILVESKIKELSELEI